MKIEEWEAHNALLQQAYHVYLHATKQKDKDEACTKIQKELGWAPFEELCFNQSAPINSIHKYGLDSVSEKCINLIDKITKGEMEYDY